MSSKINFYMIFPSSKFFLHHDSQGRLLSGCTFSIKLSHQPQQDPCGTSAGPSNQGNFRKTMARCAHHSASRSPAATKGLFDQRTLQPQRERCMGFINYLLKHKLAPNDLSGAIYHTLSSMKNNYKQIIKRSNRI